MMTTMEVIEKLECFLNIVEKSHFCTFQGTAAAVCRWSGHV